MASTDAHGGAEVLEDAAEGKIKTVYDDIKATFRVPLVNLVFRRLAAHPEYLQLAWQQLQPNVQTLYFERQADLIRAQAVERVANLGQAPAATNDALRDTVAVFHYVNPKLLIAVAALRAATNGQCPKLGDLSTDDKRRVPVGIPDNMPPIALVDAESASGDVARVFDEIQSAVGLGILSSDYRALAQWPDYLSSAWQALQPVMASTDYRRAERELRLMAERAIVLLPFRLELSPHTLRLCGMGEAEIDSIRSLLALFYRVLPGLITNIAFLATGVLGGASARNSPYPLTEAPVTGSR